MSCNVCSLRERCLSKLQVDVLSKLQVVRVLCFCEARTLMLLCEGRTLRAIGFSRSSSAARENSRRAASKFLQLPSSTAQLVRSCGLSGNFSTPSRSNSRALRAFPLERNDLTWAARHIVSQHAETLAVLLSLCGGPLPRPPGERPACRLIHRSYLHAASREGREEEFIIKRLLVSVASKKVQDFSGLAATSDLTSVKRIPIMLTARIMYLQRGRYMNGILHHCCVRGRCSAVLMDNRTGCRFDDDPHHSHPNWRLCAMQA